MWLMLKINLLLRPLLLLLLPLLHVALTQW
jgi:hypothetical protein